jgi:hypothetical protein
MEIGVREWHLTFNISSQKFLRVFHLFYTKLVLQSLTFCNLVIQTTFTEDAIRRAGILLRFFHPAFTV